MKSNKPRNGAKTMILIAALICVVCVLVAVYSVKMQSTKSDQKPSPIKSNSDCIDTLIPGNVSVLVKDGVTRTAIEPFIVQAGGKITAEYSNIGAYEVTVPEGSEAQVISLLKERPEIFSIEQSRPACFLPN